MTDDPGAPDILTVPAPEITRVQDALVVPVSPGRDLACGVLGLDGQLVQASRTLVSSRRFTGVPEAPHSDTATEIDHLKGRYLYAGLGRHHFGHFLLECIPRLWALDDPDLAVDGILVTPLPGIDFKAVMRRRLGPFLDLLTDGLPIIPVTRPARVDEVLVPSQGIGHHNWATGTPRFRDFVRDRISTTLVPNGPERIYVSRSKLKSPEQMVDQERRIERLMGKCGYTIFHPQRHTIIEQCQHYMAARHIVGPDGSAFHLAPFAAQPGARIALIQRRWRQAAFDALAGQIKAFDHIDVTAINPVLPRSEYPEGVTAPVPPPLNFAFLKRSLNKAGFLL